MDPAGSHTATGPSQPSASERLDSWKEIAAYLKRDESTVRRWEREGLPIHRHPHKGKASIYAYKSEIDAWWNNGCARLEVTEIASTGQHRKAGLPAWVVAGITLLVLLAGGLAWNVAGLRDRVLGRPLAGEITSIAVLPLENLTGDPAQDYLVDGITDGLTTDVAQISALRVISRTSAMQYKGAKKPLPQIARELNVDAVVEGAVARAGPRVRVSVQLLDAKNDRHLWAQMYERDLRDLLDLQSEIARTIVGEIRVKLTSQEQARLVKPRSVDPAVYTAYLKGKYYAQKFTNESLWQAIRHFQEALDLDPTYAPAWADLGGAYWFLGTPSRRENGNLSTEEANRRAKAALLKAVELDPTLREPHQTLGRIKFGEWDWEGGQREFERAHELDPSWKVGTFFLITAGRFDEAVAAARWAADRNPLSYNIQLILGWAYFRAGRFDESIAQLKKTAELGPSNESAHYELAWNYAKKGKPREAVAECETALALSRWRQPKAITAQDCGWVYAVAGHRREALDIAQKLEKKGLEVGSLLEVAHIYDALGDRNRALAFLSRAYQEHAAFLPTEWANPMVSEGLKADPRFQQLIRRTGIPWARFGPTGQPVAAGSNKPLRPRQP